MCRSVLRNGMCGGCYPLSVVSRPPHLFVAQYFADVSRPQERLRASSAFCQRIAAPTSPGSTSLLLIRPFVRLVMGERPETPWQVLHVLLRPPASVVNLCVLPPCRHKFGVVTWVNAPRTLPGPIALSNPHHALPLRTNWSRWIMSLGSDQVERVHRSRLLSDLGICCSSCLHAPDQPNLAPPVLGTRVAKTNGSGTFASVLTQSREPRPVGN